MTSLALACRLGAGSPVVSLPRRVRSILSKYESTLLIPGVNGVQRFGFSPGNYVESTGQTLSAADAAVGLVVDAARSVGPELITNGTFDSGSSWSTGTGWTISGGVASKSSGTASSLIQSVPSLVAGRTYQVRIATTYLAGSWSFSIGGAATALANVSANQSFIVVAGPSNTLFSIFAGNTFEGSVDNISVRELPGIHATQATAGFKPVVRNTAGVQSWQFDAAQSQRLQLSAVPFQMADDHFVVVGGFNATSSANDPVVFSVANSLNNSPVITLGLQANGIPRMFLRDDAGVFVNRQSSDGVSAVDIPTVLTGYRRGAIAGLRKDGQGRGETVLSLGAVTLNNATVGGLIRLSAGSLFNGHVHAVIAIKGNPSDAELLTLEKWVASLQGRSL